MSTHAGMSSAAVHLPIAEPKILTPQTALERGWSIIPVGADKKPFGQMSWKQYQETRPTLAEVRAWQARNPPAWAVVTGSLSGIVTLDFDLGRGGEESFYRLTEQTDITAHRKTGSGGFHVDFVHPGWPVKTLQSGTQRPWSNGWPGLDVRGDGGYVVFAGHNLNGEYKWLRDPTPYSVEKLPADLRQMLGLLNPPAAESTPKPVAIAPAVPQAGDRADAQFMLKQALERAAVNGRNDAGFALALQLRDNGYGEAEADLIGFQFVNSVRDTNTKGRQEAYSLGEWKASLRQAYARAPRQPWDPKRNGRGADPVRRPAAEGPHEDEDATDSGAFPHADADMPVIHVTNRQLPDVTDEALSALQAANDPPVLFARSGRMVAVQRDEQGRHVIIDVGENALRGRMARAAHYIKTTSRKESTSVPPPLEIVRDLAALSPSEWRFPALEGVIEAPAIRADGTIVDTPGYDPRTALFYAPPPGLCIPEIPEAPTVDEIDWAVSMVDSAIGDFPFVDDASRANAIACMLTPFIKPAINAPTPLALFEAPQAGTGKSLLAEVVSMVARGRAGDMMSAPQDPDEWRKKITMALSMGASPVIFDNVNGKLDADALCMALTANSVGDRVFRTHEQITLPIKCAWIATGNNIRLGGDMPRRCYWIRLDAKSSKPFQRTGFRHANLLQWVGDHRGELIAALLILARVWFAQGKPSATVKPMGSFEAWTNMAAGILHSAGVEGFLGNADAMFEQSDSDAAQWEEFIETLAEVFPDSEFRAVNVVDKVCTKAAVEGYDEGVRLRNSLPDFLAEAADRSPGYFQRRLALCLTERIERRYGEGQVFLSRRLDRKTKVQYYKVVKP